MTNVENFHICFDNIDPDETRKDLQERKRLFCQLCGFKNITSSYYHLNKHGLVYPRIRTKSKSQRNREYYARNRDRIKEENRYRQLVKRIENDDNDDLDPLPPSENTPIACTIC